MSDQTKAPDDFPVAVRTDPPFERTVCGCDECVRCCREQPGYLIPGDLERIAAHLGEHPVDAALHFWASPGALVTRGLERFRIGTVTPVATKAGCVFLGPGGRCRVHPVAPFGCAYFDTHMPAREAMPRSTWGLRRVLHSPEYHAQRATMPKADTWRPRGYAAADDKEQP